MKLITRLWIDKDLTLISLPKKIWVWEDLDKDKPIFDTAEQIKPFLNIKEIIEIYIEQKLKTTVIGDIEFQFSKAYEVDENKMTIAIL